MTVNAITGIGRDSRGVGIELGLGKADSGIGGWGGDGGNGREDGVREGGRDRGGGREGG